MDEHLTTMECPACSGRGWSRWSPIFEGGMRDRGKWKMVKCKTCRGFGICTVADAKQWIRSIESDVLN